MSITVDHYESLGLPTWEEGSKLTLKQIREAYKKKALEFHLGKHPNYIFQQMKLSYDILKDENSRRDFDEELIRVKQEQQRRDSKRKKPIQDVEARKRFTPVPKTLKEREEEEIFLQKHKKEIEKIMAIYSRRDFWTGRLTADNVLKVSWEGSEDAYSVKTLKELFKQFGEVIYVVPKEASNTGNGVYCRYIHMKTRDAALSALGAASGHPSNPFTVRHLGPSTPTQISSSLTERQAELLKTLCTKDAEAA